jgi:hypothetical protein
VQDGVVGKATTTTTATAPDGGETTTTTTTTTAPSTCIDGWQRHVGIGCFVTTDRVECLLRDDCGWCSDARLQHQCVDVAAREACAAGVAWEAFDTPADVCVAERGLGVETSTPPSPRSPPYILYIVLAVAVVAAIAFVIQRRRRRVLYESDSMDVEFL